MKITLLQPFGRNVNANEFDVRQMKKMLNRLGYYLPQDKTGITGIADEGVFTALKAFQKDIGLKATGAAQPDDATVEALNKEGEKTPEGQYIWHCTDDDKVRAAHAELNGTVRDWADSPDPGEDYNCRCWAGPYKKVSCGLEIEALKKAEENCKALEARKNTLRADIEKLISENNHTVQALQKTLGGQIATSILGLPLERLNFVGEILQRFFGNAVSSKISEKSDQLGKELSAIRSKIEYKKQQLTIVIIELNKAAAEMEKAKQDLEKCQNSIKQ